MGGAETKTSTVDSKQKISVTKKLLYVLFALVIAISPMVFDGFGYSFMTRIMAVCGLYVMLALGLNIVVGLAGLLDLGYIAFYAVGAYSGVIIGSYVIKHLAATPAMAWLAPYTFLLMIPVAGAFAALAGIMLGTPVLRLRGDYLAIVTLGFGEIVRICINNNMFGITNGAAGIIYSPKVQIFGYNWLVKNVDLFINGIGPNGYFELKWSQNLYWYYMIVALCLLTIFVVRRLDHSRLGRSWAAMREDEVAAASMGVSITKTKLWAFSLGAMWGGIAGLTFANYQQFVSPESFSFMESVFVVCVVVIGGMGSVWGAIVGALLIQGLPALIQGLAISGIIPGLTGTQVTMIGNYRNLVFAIVMVTMMALRPQGIIPSKRRAAELKPDTLEMAEIESEQLYDAQHDVAHPDDEL